jgi:hypothetical protein
MNSAERPLQQLLSDLYAINGVLVMACILFMAVLLMRVVLLLCCPFFDTRAPAGSRLCHMRSRSSHCLLALAKTRVA